MTRLPLLRLLRPLAWMFVLGMAATGAFAGTTTISVGLDTDNNSATGCVLSTANGPVPGIEQVASTVVTTTVTGATVTRLERQVCVGGVLGAPTLYDNGGWNVGLGNGTSGSAVVETSIPLSVLPAAGTMKAVVVADNGTGGQDATATFAITLLPASGPAGPIMVPLTPWLVPLLATLLFATTLWLRRRYPEQTGLLVMLVVFTASGLVWAATVIRDGNIGDWNGVAPAIIDAAGDAPVNADVVAVFYQQDGANLYLRIDADIRRDTPGNQAPHVNAGPNQTITLPAGVMLNGSATDDGLPNPPAMLTYAWTKFSGPGTVTFGNAASAATTATFGGQAGTYILRLTVSDSALSGFSDVIITVNPPGATNQPPVVNAGPNQTITLPASAALSGSATDDGLPNPPGILTYAWTKFSGPGPVTFGNATSAATTATFTMAGTYVLRLTVSDSALSGSANVTIIVNPPGPANQPPVVNAGPNQTITLPAGATLSGSATDDGLPNPPGMLLTTWSVASGPGAGVLFFNASSASTVATFLAAGTYVLRLTANDGAASTSSTVQVIVNDGAPQFVAIADRTILLGSRFQLMLQAIDTNVNDTLNFALIAAPSGATLNPSPLIDWTPTAAQIGTNTFTARVTDSGGHSATTTFSVTVVRVNQPPQLDAQNNQTVAIGNPFTRTLTAFDPDAGDVLTFTLVSGPAGMTLMGADLNWPSSGRTAGDYAVSVRVTDASGATDQKSFTITLTPAASAVAKDDSYSVKVGRALTVPAPGVLANDVSPGAGTLTATRLSAPGVGTLTAFNGDGSFTYQAPATPPGDPLTVTKLWSAGAGSDRHRELVADLNGDGYPDIISFDNNAGIRARSGLDGSQLWSADNTGATDCRLHLSASGSGDQRVLADINDSGHPSLALTTLCDRTDPTGSTWDDNIVAFDHLGKVKWVSPPLSKPHPDIRRGATPVPPGGFTPGGLAHGRGLSVARLSVGGPPVLLMRAEIPVNYGYTYYRDAANADHYAGCRAVTGLVADENVACRATFIISGTDGSVLQTLVVRNPAATDTFYGSGPNSLIEMPPIAMDIDGDGRVDLVSGTEVWMQNAGGGFDFAWQLTASVNDTAVADLDGDGKAEIIHIRASGFPEDLRGIFIYSHDGQLKRRIPLRAFWITPLTIADVDGDGRSDIVVGGDGTLYAFRDDGRPIWAYKVPQDVPTDPILAPFYTQPPQELAVANAAPQVYDLDGDGVAEVVFAAHSRIIILNGRTGVRKVDPYWTFNDSYHDVSALMLIDMNNDGHVDIVQNAPFIFNCEFVGADFLSACLRLIGPTVLRGGGSNNWLPGPKAFPNVQYRSTAIDSNARVLYDTKVSRVFRVPEQQGTVRDPRLAQATSFTYSASDGSLSSAPATVFIDIVPDNQPPVFTSTPPKSLWQHFDPNPPGLLVTNYYDVTAFDPDPGDTVTFSLKSAPSWVTMSGPARIRFEPTCGSYGYPCPWGWTTVIVTATDSRGASTDQIFIVNLTTDSRTVPNVVGMLFEVAETTLIAQDLQGVKWVETFGLQPAGTVLAQDAVAGAVVGRFDDIRLTVSKGPQPVLMPFVIGQQLAAARTLLTGLGLAVNVTLVPSATVPVGQVMAQQPDFGTLITPSTATPVTLTVSSGSGQGSIVRIVIDPAPTVRLVGDDVAYHATAIYADATSTDITLATTWSSSAPNVANISATGNAHAVAPGSSTITATLGSTSGQTTLTVMGRVADAVLPTAIISSPADSATVTEVAPVTGTASDASFLRYELAMAAGGDSNFTLLFEGQAEVVNGMLGTFDPTLLENGAYVIRLTVFDKGGNTSVTETAVVVDGNQKVGNFTLAYSDLTVPLAGIPIQIVRTYDSRNKAKGDFGIGWTIGLKALRVSNTRVPGEAWEVVKSGLNYSLVAKGEHVITVTLPNGKVESFDLRITPNVSPLVPFSTVRASFSPRPGTLGTLRSLDNTDLLIVEPQPGPITLIDDTSLNTFHPDKFLYTQRDGTQFVVTRTRGVESVQDNNGNQLTIGLTGITHSSGASVTFARDAQGRITGMTDPKGQTRTYAYSASGDLASATDRAGSSTQYFYNRVHGLVRIQDPLGRTASRTDYDDQGRVIAITDATGNTTNYLHDLPGRQEQIEDALGRITVINYDDRGNVTAVTDALGHTTRSTYDAGNRLLTRTDALGATTSFAYDTQGNLTSRTNPLGGTTTYSSDAAGRRLTSTDPRGNTSRWQYDAAGNLIAKTDAMGRITTYGVDAAGNLTSLTDPSGATTRNAYSNAGHRTQLTDAVGTITLFIYDANGSLLSQQDDGGVTTNLVYDAENRIAGTQRGGLQRSLAYDAAGFLATVTTATNRRMALATDPAGRLSAVVDPTDGTVMQQTYDAVGNTLSVTGSTGQQTRYTYDGANRLTSIHSPDGGLEQRAYDAAGRVAQVIDPQGFATRYEYDAAGQLLSITDALGGQTRFQYDASGNKIAETDALGRTTQFDYDALNQLVRTTRANGNVESLTYDADGHVIRAVDALGAATDYTYDSLGRLVTLTDALGQRVQHSYQGSLGLPVTTTDANGQVTRHAYDGTGRRTSTTFPLGDVESVTYDAAGNVLSSTNGTGESVQHQFDTRGRRSATSLPGGGTESYGYTSDGRIRTVTDARGTTTLDYDTSTRRLSKVTEPDGRYVRYTYATGGRKTAMVQSDAIAELVTQYAYDALNRLTRITHPGGGVTTQAWDAVGNLVAVARPNGVTTTTTYDVLNRPLVIAHRGSAAVLLQSETYTRNALGNIARIDRNDGSRVDFQYDVLGRVTREAHFDGANSLTSESAFAYDAAGNRIRSGVPLAPISYVYNADNQLVSAGDVTYTYDAAGRRTQESSIVGGQIRTIQYTWDARDRLVSYRDVSGLTASYVYDWAGLRQGKSGSPGPITELTDRDSMTGFAQLVRSSSATRADTFVWGGDLISTTEGGAERFRLADSLGSTRILTGSNGAVTDTFDYTAIGDLLGHVGPSSAPHRYAGEQSDPESGLIYLRARYYDPRSGVFVSRDSREGTPGYPLSLNRYVYADGNPVNRTDPSGHETLLSLSLAQGLSGYARGQDILKVRRGLAAAFDVEANAARVAGGVMGVEAVIEAVGGDHGRVNQWFGIGRLASAAADLLVTDLGGGLNSAVDVAAGLAMLKTAFDMLGRNDVYIGIEGVGVLLANSVDEAQNQLRADTSTGNYCVSRPGEALAWAIQPSATTHAAIELCTKFLSQPFAPNASTLTTRARASMAGIMLHEYTHLALKTKDAPFDCPAVARALVPGAALFNADSYRCWGEDAAVGWSGTSVSSGQ